MAVYVDDIKVLYKDKSHFDVVKSDLDKYFSLKSLGELNFYLGLNISKKDGVIRVNQKTMINSLLEKYNVCSAKVASTPLAVEKLNLNETEPFEDCRSYQALVGSLMYIAINTRLDIAMILYVTNVTRLAVYDRNASPL